MRYVMAGFALVLAVGWPAGAEARDKPVEELTQDMWTLAFAWTEPIKHVVKETRRFDPVSGFWFGLLEGSIKSFERTAAVFFPPPQEAPEEQPGGPKHEPLEEPLLRYTF
ncbi:MAG: hypothetical protein HYT90_02620 [Candidatus Omnitrophica bacterium]|nr:hypothetical protein [Candidatus Omnitrophota bacterium]